MNFSGSVLGGSSQHVGSDVQQELGGEEADQRERGQALVQTRPWSTCRRRTRNASPAMRFSYQTEARLASIGTQGHLAAGQSSELSGHFRAGWWRVLDAAVLWLGWRVASL